jgi:type I pantothenate kinase
VSESRFVTFDREEWSTLRAATPLTLTDDDLAQLRGINERVDLDEVADVYLPLSRLLNLYVATTQNLHTVTDTFLGRLPARVPYVIGIAGSVAVGKSTTARVLRALLARGPDEPAVDLITTDGFLLPNRVLAARELMKRKGFPESYDVRRLVRFLSDVKAGHSEVVAPTYSHTVYDVVEGESQIVRRPDILIVEGLNVLQTWDGRSSRPSRLFVSDFFDFSIYVDAEERHVERWYVERFLKLRDTVFQDELSYFHRYADLSTEDAVATAEQIWAEINAPNLRENILPTRERAQLILTKGANHAVESVRLRKL